jgi:hypothetical protein
MQPDEQPLIDVNQIDEQANVDQEEVQADHSEQVEEPAAEASDAPQDSDWNQIMSAVGDIPEEDDILSKLTPRHIEKLPAEARGIVRMAIGRSQKEYQQRQSVLEKRNAELDQRAERIKTDSKALLDERARMADIFSSQELKKYLDDADSIDPKKLDLLTREGREAFLQREAAEGIRKISEPITRAAVRAQREKRYRDFREKHPHMTDKSFRDEVLALGKQMESHGRPIQLEDAYNRVLVQRQRAQSNAKRKQRQQVRAESMKHVGKRTVSSTKAPEPFTMEKRKAIRKSGYHSKGGQKFFGEAAVAMYLKEHPEDLKALRSQQQKRRVRR